MPTEAALPPTPIQAPKRGCELDFSRCCAGQAFLSHPRRAPPHTHSLMVRVHTQDSGVDATLGPFRLGISILRMLIRQYLLITRRLHGSLNRKDCISLAGMQGDRYVESYTTFCVYKLSLKVMRYSARLSPCFLEYVLDVSVSF